MNLKQLLETFETEEAREICQSVVFLRNPIEIIRSGELSIRTKSGEIRPLIPNFAQNILLDLVEKRIREGKPVRIRLLKARQLGFSTLIEAIIYAFTSHREGFHSLVIADDEDGSKELFEMNKLYHERFNEVFKPTLKKSNEIALEFEGLKSRIDIDTSRNKNAGRGSTYQIVHKSESSRFQFPKEVNLGVANAVADLPGTMIFDETTANGMNFYYDDVQRSMRGEDGYDFLFIPWFFNPEYSMPTYKETFSRTSEEDDIKEQAFANYKMSLTDEQLQWRRFTIEHKCGGDLKLFRQEYPANVEEAFIFSGRPRFDVDILRKLKTESKPPIKKSGILNIYQEIEPLSKYIIGCDTSEGLATGDNSSVTILNCRDYSVAAHYSGKVEPDILASYLDQWGLEWNEALIVVESNNHGLVTIKYLKETYKYLYSRKIYDKLSDQWTEKIGFQTSARTKPILISNLDRALRSGLSILSADIIDELLTYVIEDDGSTNASEGKKDDNVISLALAIQGYYETSEHTLPEPKIEAPRYSVQSIMKNKETKEHHRWSR